MKSVIGRWLEVVSDEYLDGFVRDGGSVVRFLGAEPDRLASSLGQLREKAAASGYHTVSLEPGVLLPDGRKPHLHRMDRLATMVLGSIDWPMLVERAVRQALTEAGLEIPEGPIGDLAALAEANGRDAQDLRRRFERFVHDRALADRDYCVEFRLAIAALVRARLLPSEVSAITERAVLYWLRGVQEPGAMTQLKRIGIHDRIGRMNGRWILQSAAHWLPTVGTTGLAVFLDLRAYERTPAASKSIPDGGDGLYYSRPSFIQMLELLRRFLDDIGEYRSLLLVVCATPDFYGVGRRNYRDYEALYGRIANEVRPVGRPNPAAVLYVDDGGKR